MLKCTTCSVAFKSQNVMTDHQHVTKEINVDSTGSTYIILPSSSPTGKAGSPALPGSLQPVAYSELQEQVRRRSPP